MEQQAKQENKLSYVKQLRALRTNGDPALNLNDWNNPTSIAFGKLLTRSCTMILVHIAATRRCLIEQATLQFWLKEEAGTQTIVGFPGQDGFTDMEFLVNVPSKEVQTLLQSQFETLEWQMSCCGEVLVPTLLEEAAKNTDCLSPYLLAKEVNLCLPIGKAPIELTPDENTRKQIRDYISNMVAHLMPLLWGGHIGKTTLWNLLNHMERVTREVYTFSNQEGIAGNQVSISIDPKSISSYFRR